MRWLVIHASAVLRGSAGLRNTAKCSHASRQECHRCWSARIPCRLTVPPATGIPGGGNLTGGRCRRGGLGEYALEDRLKPSASLTGRMPALADITERAIETGIHGAGNAPTPGTASLKRTLGCTLQLSYADADARPERLKKVGSCPPQ